MQTAPATAAATLPTLHYAKQCGGKKPYFTFPDALKDATALFTKSREIVYPYRCAYCRHLHNGHPAPDQQARTKLLLELEQRKVEIERRVALGLPLTRKTTTAEERAAADRLATKQAKAREVALLLAQKQERKLRGKRTELLNLLRSVVKARTKAECPDLAEETDEERYLREYDERQRAMRYEEKRHKSKVRHFVKTLNQIVAARARLAEGGEVRAVVARMQDEGRRYPEFIEAQKESEK